MLLPYRPSNFKEKVLKLPVIGLTSQEDVLRSSSRVPAPPTSAETSGYKRTLNNQVFTSTKLTLSTAFFFSTFSKTDVTSTSLSISPTSDAPLPSSIKLSIAEASSALENVNLDKSPGLHKLPSSILKERADELQCQSIRWDTLLSSLPPNDGAQDLGKKFPQFTRLTTGKKCLSRVSLNLTETT